MLLGWCGGWGLSPCRGTPQSGGIGHGRRSGEVRPAVVRTGRVPARGGAAYVGLVENWIIVSSSPVAVGLRPATKFIVETIAPDPPKAAEGASISFTFGR